MTQPAPPPVPVRVNYDPLTRFRRRIAQNARGWLGFLLEQPAPDLPASADREFANLYKAAEQALAEPSAWADGVRLADAMWPVISGRGHWPEWDDMLGRALAAVEQLTDPDMEARILDQWGELARFLGDAPQALARQQTALDLFRRQEDAQGIGLVLNHLSQAYMTLGDHSAAKACCQEAASIFAATGNQTELAQAHLRWGLVCSELTELEEALTHHRLAEEIFVGLGNVRGQAMAANNQGYTLWLMKAYPDAVTAFEQAIALHTAANDEINAARSRVNLANVYDPLGEPAKGLALNREAEPRFRRLGDRPWLARVLNNQGIFLEQLGRMDEAADAYGQAVQMHRSNGNLAYAAMTLLSITEMWIKQERLDLARAAWTEADQLLAGLPHPPPREMARLAQFRQAVGR